MENGHSNREEAALDFPDDQLLTFHHYTRIYLFCADVAGTCTLCAQTSKLASETNEFVCRVIPVGPTSESEVILTRYQV